MRDQVSRFHFDFFNSKIYLACEGNFKISCLNIFDFIENPDYRRKFEVDPNKEGKPIRELHVDDEDSDSD